MNLGKIAFLISTCSLTIGLTSCKLGPEYTSPDFDLPDEYHGTDHILSNEESRELINLPWWEQFNAPALNKVINEALAANLDLRIATSRIEEARQSYRSTHGKRLPQFGYEGEADREQNSGDSNSRGSIDDTFELGLTFSWELDVWGRLKRADEAALAEYLKTVEARRGVLLSLISDVAKTYFEIDSALQQLEISHNTVKTRTNGLEIAELRFNGGLTSELEVRQAETALLQAQIKIPSLEKSLSLSKNRMSILLGRAPTPVTQKNKSLERSTLPKIPLGLPSELLRQRPDLLQAEQELIARNAEVGIAIANRFPQFSMSASAGWESDSTNTLFDKNRDVWTLTGNLAGPIFDGGTLKAESEAAKLRFEQSLLAYEQSILQALAEVSNALENMRETGKNLELQAKLETTSKQYLELAWLRYGNGIVSYLDVLDAQRELFNTQLDAVTANQNQMNATVDLYKALGGGWSVAEGKLPPIEEAPKS